MRESLLGAIAQLEAYLAKLRANPSATSAQIATIEKVLAELRKELGTLGLTKAS